MKKGYPFYKKILNIYSKRPDVDYNINGILECGSKSDPTLSPFFSDGIFNFFILDHTATSTPKIYIRHDMYHTTNSVPTGGLKLPYSETKETTPKYTNSKYDGYCFCNSSTGFLKAIGLSAASIIYSNCITFTRIFLLLIIW